MKIEAIKEKARSHEQNEEWQKALDLYLDAIRKLSEDEDGQPDISLYNRAGDLQTRIGNVEAAIQHYEEAIDHYLEADLANNAIAICKKVLRNLPERADIYLRLGQIRANQGFIVDARQNFLTYAELRQQEGEMDEAFRALVEFADLAPEEVEIRMTVAQQLESSDRIEEAVGQYVKAYQQYARQEEHDAADQVRARIEELDPEAEIPEPEAVAAGEAEVETGFGELPGFETTGFDMGEEEEEEDEEEPPAEVEADLEEFDLGGEEEEEDAEELEEVALEGEITLDAEIDEEEESEEDAEPLPMMEFGDEDEEEVEEESEEDAEPLPMMEFGEDEEDEEDEELPPLEAEIEDFDTEDEADEDELVEVASSDEPSESLEEAVEEEALEERLGEEEDAVAEDDHAALAQAGDFEGAMRVLRKQIMETPDDIELHQRLVEYAHRAGDKTLLVPAYLDLADCLERQGAGSKARAVYQQVLAIDPENRRAKAGVEGRRAPDDADRDVSVASSDEEYVDLGSMVMDEDEEKTTRWVVSAEEPTGDEEADFAAMLSQFKQKVAENVGQDDLHAHYDLGTAYKEMGLLDEAIGEFQQALRADSEHLATYEMLGQCFLEQEEYEVAIRSLTKAVAIPDTIEDDLIGIYYHLGRAHERAGNTDSAREFYEKVFALDINFADVTERLRALR